MLIKAYRKRNEIFEQKNNENNKLNDIIIIGYYIGFIF